ncbi:MAG: DUF3192 domain-containing protein [Candidatus Omnitrophica bacterium]|nr:DUF3192 domain-containing protein [Candidatus Omnitrophota bacterium]
MKNIEKICLSILCLCLGGCMTIGDGSLNSTGPLSKKFADFSAVQIGMTDKEVAGLIKDRAVVGYQRSDLSSSQFQPIEVQNPYRVEVLEIRGESYQVLYYLSSLVRADGLISDEELMPLVFKNNKLVAKGWNDLLRLKNQ